MELVDRITPINADKVVIGSKEMILTVETETGRVTVEAPVMMFTNPVFSLDDLLEKLQQLQDQYEQIRKSR